MLGFATSEISRTGELKGDGPGQRLTKHHGGRPVTECGKHPLQHQTKSKNGCHWTLP